MRGMTLRSQIVEWGLVALMGMVLVGTCSALDFPGPVPSAARSASDGTSWILENEVIVCRWLAALPSGHPPLRCPKTVVGPAPALGLLDGS
jgi:hypothetical protein